ncbi:MAG: PQQ-binding-like beta-propeller repeat protein [Gemmatales bacterium]|nr:PQQ-binding-like beta-propeller repeat protein [Gemmatales bacterium]MDW8174566.1 PQQ-binding-like beta-propeller repeat protein [Gemmatales bacterium]
MVHQWDFPRLECDGQGVGLTRRYFLGWSLTGPMLGAWSWAHTLAQNPIADAEPCEEVRAYQPGPAQRYVHWVGQMSDFRLFRYWRDRYTCDDFAFHFRSKEHGDWLVISREPTPWYSWRLGPTYTEAVSGTVLSSRPRVRLVGLKNAVDRLPPVLQQLPLKTQQVVTALIVEVWVEQGSAGRWVPWYINNWFHSWGHAADNAWIARHYVGKPAPWYLVFSNDAAQQIVHAGFTERTVELLKKYGDIPRPGRGYLLVPAMGKTPPWQLELAVVVNPRGEFVHGTEQGLPRTLTTTVLRELRPCGGWEMIGKTPDHMAIAEGPLEPPLRLRWRFPARETPKPREDGFVGNPCISNGRLYIGNNNGLVYCLDARSGKRYWSFACSSYVECTPAARDNRIVFGSFDGNVYCLDAQNGKLLWQFATGPRLPGTKGYNDVTRGVDSSPALVNGLVYFGAWDGHLYCLELDTGRLVWKQQLGGLVHRSGPAVDEMHGRVYIGATDGFLYCFEAKKGHSVWRRQLCERHMDHCLADPVLDGGRVYMGADRGSVYCLDANKGDVLWHYRQAKHLIAGAVTVYGGRVYGFTDGGGQLFCLDAASGKELWSVYFGNGWGGCQPLVCPSQGGQACIIYVTMRDGQYGKQPVSLAAVSWTGKVLWTWATGNVWGSPILVNEMLYFGSDDGYLYALEKEVS